MACWTTAKAVSFISVLERLGMVQICTDSEGTQAESCGLAGQTVPLPAVLIRNKIARGKSNTKVESGRPQEDELRMRQRAGQNAAQLQCVRFHWEE